MNKYVERGRALLEQARLELDAGDWHNASEQGWRAGEQALKAYAATRDLPHNSLGYLLAASSRLRSETGDDTYRVLFSQALALHENSDFYESGFTTQEIRELLGNVAELIDKIETMLNGRNGTTTP